MPTALEGPVGSNTMELRMLLRLLQIVMEPAAVATLPQTIIIVHTLTPRAWVKYFVGIGIAYVLVEDILREFTVEQIKL